MNAPETQEKRLFFRGFLVFLSGLVLTADLEKHRCCFKLHYFKLLECTKVCGVIQHQKNPNMSQDIKNCGKRSVAEIRFKKAHLAIRNCTIYVNI